MNVKEWSDDGHNVTLDAAHRSTLVATVTVSLTSFPDKTVQATGRPERSCHWNPPQSPVWPNEFASC